MSIQGSRNLDAGSRRTIFWDLLNADIPPSEKHPDRLWQEGFLFVGAGTETTALGEKETPYLERRVS